MDCYTDQYLENMRKPLSHVPGLAAIALFQYPCYSILRINENKSLGIWNSRCQETQFYEKFSRVPRDENDVLPKVADNIDHKEDGSFL